MPIRPAPRIPTRLIAALLLPMSREMRSHPTDSLSTLKEQLDILEEKLMGVNAPE